MALFLSVDGRMDNVPNTNTSYVFPTLKVLGTTNINGLQINGRNGTGGYVLSATGTGSGVAWTPLAAGTSQWTGTVGSPIYYVPNVGIGASTAATAKLQVTGNLYVSNSVTTTNVYATRFVGDGGLLSNVTAVGFIQPLSNLVVSNSVTTTNVFVNGTLSVPGAMSSNIANTTFFYDTLTIPYINTQVLNVASVSVASNISTVGFTSNALNTVFNYSTLTVPFINASTLNVASTSNLGPMYIASGAGVTSLTVTGNVFASNALVAPSIYGTLTGTHYGILSGSNTIAGSTQTLTGTAGVTSLNATGNLYVSNALTTMNLFATGNTSSISNMVIQSFDFVVAATAGSYSNVCSITDVPNGSAIYAIYVDMMARGAGGSAQTKTYIIVSNYNATTGVWTRALPIGNPSAGGQTGLDVMTLNGTTILRVTNRNAAETVNIGMVVKVSSSSFSRVAITDLTSAVGSTGTGATQTGFYPTTLLTQVANRVGLSIEVPTANLHVGGNQIIAGLTGTTSLNVTGNVFASNALVAPSIYGTLTGTHYGILAGANTIAGSTQTLASTAGVTSLNVTGNVYTSNSMTTTNVFAGTVSTTNPISFRNRVINGDFLIDQRNAGAATTPTVDGKPVIDRWKANIVGSGRCQVGQGLGGILAPAGFTSYLGMKVTTTTTVGAGDYFFLSQVIEGVNTIDWFFGQPAAKTVTLGFWVYSSITGTMGGFVRNAGTSAGNYTRSYPFTFTVNSINTWEYKTITLAGDTTGTWYRTQTDGIEFGIDLWNGTTFQSSPGAWAAGNYTGPSGGTIDFAGTLNSYVYITGIQFETGPVATPFERRHYSYELAMCQRYYETTIARLGGYNLTGGGLRSSVYFNTKKRPAASPTFTVISAVETPINMGTVNIDNSNFDGSSARIIASITTTGDGYGQWKVAVDCEF